MHKMHICMKNRVYIKKVLSADLKSRSTVHTLLLSLNGKNLNDVIFDFYDVNFASRSFLDEFYNVFLKKHKARVENISEDIKIILDTVSRTQDNKSTLVKSKNVRSFKTVDDFCSHIKNISF